MLIWRCSIKASVGLVPKASHYCNVLFLTLRMCRTRALTRVARSISRSRSRRTSPSKRPVYVEKHRLVLLLLTLWIHANRSYSPRRFTIPESMTRGTSAYLYFETKCVRREPTRDCSLTPIPLQWKPAVTLSSGG